MTNRPNNTANCPSCGAHASGKFCSKCGASLSEAACSDCGARLAPGARFCNECGKGVSAGAVRMPETRASATSNALSSYLPWGVAALFLFAVLGYFAGRGMGGGSGTPSDGSVPLGTPSSAAPFANGASGGAAPDISAMTPRDRANRLYDRIMRYTEEGKKDSAQFFAPMALASFEMLGADMDLDARYDYGRVASETGSLDIAAAQADTILKASPTHLLGLALRARTATLRGDSKGASSAWKTFLGARDAEMAKNLPEYQMHGTDIAQAVKLAQNAK